jgi:single-stranded-DNA-specific exonuclease
MEKAVLRVKAALLSHEKVFVFGDYDVDGITASFLLIQFFRYLGLAYDYYIPNRFKDGYGFGSDYVKKIQESGCKLIIVVDSGTNSVDAVKEAGKLGIDAVILDHHTPSSSGRLPKAVAVVNPKRFDQREVPEAGIKNLCSAGVVFLFLIALRRDLRAIGFFEKFGEPDIKEFLDVVSLGTVCDAMDLRGINRACLKYVLSSNKNSSIIKLCMDHFNISKIDSPEIFSFVFGPLLNAAGRLSDPHIALDLFLAEDKAKSLKILEKLKDLNKTRKDIESQMLKEALIQIKDQNLDEKNAICVSKEDWNEGVVGIIAGKLTDKFQKPTFVITIGKDGMCRGSARSIEGVPLSEVFEAAKKRRVIEKGGGHALAGGFSLLKAKIPEFYRLIIESKHISSYNAKKSIDIDCILSAKENIPCMLKSISCLEPFGKGFKSPTFCFMRLRLLKFSETKDRKHMQLFFRGENGGDIKCIIFNVEAKADTVECIVKNRDSLFDIAAEIKPSTSFGYSVILEDIRLSEPEKGRFFKN